MSGPWRQIGNWLRTPGWEQYAQADAPPDAPPGAQAKAEATISDLEDERRRLRYLGVLNRAWLAFGVVALVTMPLYPYWRLSLTIAVGTAITYLIVQGLLRQRLLLIASIAFCICTDIVFLAMFVVLGERMGMAEAFRTEAPVLMLMGITTLFAGALIGPRSGLVVAAVNTVAIVGLRLSLAPETEPRPSTIVFGWLLACIAFLYEHSLRDVFAQLRAVRMGLEATVAARTKELRDSIDSLEKLAVQLIAANRDLELFSSSVAHDLRDPLRTIEGYSRLLQQDFAANNPDAAQALQRMLQVESRMSRLIEGLLSFARLGEHALTKQSVDMRVLAQRIAAELRERESARILNIEVGALHDCNADLLLIEQVVVNLVTNAIKFTRPRSVAQIIISSRRSDTELIYSVKDNGVGFPMQYAGRLFNTLQRLHAYEEFEGTGIGLATVQRIMQRHNGRVWAQAEQGVGAEFFFALPN